MVIRLIQIYSGKSLKQIPNSGNLFDLIFDKFRNKMKISRFHFYDVTTFLQIFYIDISRTRIQNRFNKSSRRVVNINLLDRFHIINFQIKKIYSRIWVECDALLCNIRGCRNRNTEFCDFYSIGLLVLIKKIT